MRSDALSKTDKKWAVITGHVILILTAGVQYFDIPPLISPAEESDVGFFPNGSKDQVFKTWVKIMFKKDTRQYGR